MEISLKLIVLPKIMPTSNIVVLPYFVISFQFLVIHISFWFVLEQLYNSLYASEANLKSISIQTAGNHHEFIEESQHNKTNHSKTVHIFQENAINIISGKLQFITPRYWTNSLAYHTDVSLTETNMRNCLRAPGKFILMTRGIPQYLSSTHQLWNIRQHWVVTYFADAFINVNQHTNYYCN